MQVDVGVGAHILGAAIAHFQVGRRRGAPVDQVVAVGATGGKARDLARGQQLLAVLGFENTYALAMRAEQARALGIRRISDLREHAPGLEIASDYEFFARAEWKALETRYGLRFAEERGMDPALMYEAIRTGSVEVISAYSTDGRIAAYDLQVLEDDLGVIPPYDAIVLGSARLLRNLRNT